MKNIDRHLLEIIVVTVGGVFLNYTNQFLTWKFESYFHAGISFIIFSVLYIGLLIIYFPKLVRFVKRISINTEVVPKERIVHKIFKYGKSLFSLFLFVGLCFIYIFSFFQFSNYYFFKRELLGTLNIHEVTTYIEDASSKKANWAIVNNLLNEFGDDETNAFAVDLQNSFETTINTYKFPILVFHDIPEQEIDSLAGKYEVIYVIKGTYSKGIARINISKRTKENILKLFLSQIGAYRVENLPTIDSLISLEVNNKIINEKHSIAYDSDNATLSKYNLRLGVPNEINHIVYLTLAEYVTKNLNNSIATFNVEDSQGLKEIGERINLGLKLLEIADLCVPLEVNYWGVRPKVRSGFSVHDLYALELNLNILKAKILLGSSPPSNRTNMQDINAADEILKLAEYYYENLPNSIDEENDKDLVRSVGFQLVKIYYLEALQSLNNSKMYYGISTIEKKIERLKNGEGSPELGRFGGSFTNRVTKESIDNLLTSYDHVSELVENANDIIDESLRLIKKVLKTMKKNEIYQSNLFLTNTVSNVNEQIIKNREGVQQIAVQIRTQRAMIEEVRDKVK